MTENTQNFLVNNELLQLIENTPICIKVFDRDFKIVYVNAGGRLEHKLKEDTDLSKWKWIETVNKKDADQIKERFDEAVKSGKSSQVEFEHESEGSTREWCLGLINPVKNDQGEVKYVLLYSIDISKYKKILNQLSENEQRYRSLYMNSIDAIMVLTPQEGFIGGNPATVSLFNCRDEQDFTSHTPADLSPEYQQDGTLSTVKAQEMMMLAMKNGSHFFEWTHQKASGEIFPATVLLSSLELDGRKVLQATVRDISESKELEKELQVDAAIFKNLAEGIYLIGLDDLIIKWANPNFEKMFGYGSGELNGKQVDIVNAPAGKTPTETRMSIVEILKQTGQWHGEVNNIKKDGIRFWCYANVSLFDHPRFGRVIVAVHTDITHLKETDLALAQSGQRYKILLDSVPLCIKWFDSMGNLVSINQGARQEHFLTGKNDQEIKNWPYMSCIKENYHQQVKEGMRLAFEGKINSFEMEHVEGTSTGRWCMSSLVPVSNAAGKIDMVLFISRDITAEKEAKEKEQQSIDELKRLNKLMVGRELKMVEMKKEIENLRSLQKTNK